MDRDNLKIQISLKFVPIIPIDNQRALVHIRTWYRISDKPLSEPMVVYFTDIYTSLDLNELNSIYTYSIFRGFSSVATFFVIGAGHIYIYIFIYMNLYV